MSRRSRRNKKTIGHYRRSIVKNVRRTTFKSTSRPARLHYSQIDRMKRGRVIKIGGALASPSINKGFSRRLFPQVSVKIINKKALICAKRQIKREVIHAKGYAGSQVRIPKFNQQSKVRCK